MSNIIWEDVYSVGIVEFDNDHRIVVNLINKLEDACACDKADAAMDPVLLAIMAYTESHFQREEALMKRHHYPGLAEHRAAHAALAAAVADFYERYRDGGDAGISAEFLRFLHDWWSTHILGMDMAYKAFFEAKGVTTAGGDADPPGSGSTGRRRPG